MRNLTDAEIFFLRSKANKFHLYKEGTERAKEFYILSKEKAEFYRSLFKPSKTKISCNQTYYYPEEFNSNIKKIYNNIDIINHWKHNDKLMVYSATKNYENKLYTVYEYDVDGDSIFINLYQQFRKTIKFRQIFELFEKRIALIPSNFFELIEKWDNKEFAEQILDRKLMKEYDIIISKKDKKVNPPIKKKIKTKPVKEETILEIMPQSKSENKEKFYRKIQNTLNNWKNSESQIKLIKDLIVYHHNYKHGIFRGINVLNSTIEVRKNNYNYNTFYIVGDDKEENFSYIKCFNRKFKN